MADSIIQSAKLAVTTKEAAHMKYQLGQAETFERIRSARSR
jgi:hypothetical protein